MMVYAALAGPMLLIEEKIFHIYHYYYFILTLDNY